MAAHIASPHNRRGPKKGLGRMPLVAQEDIGAVLDRFHKWAGQQQKPVREITYEEAIARSRRRVRVEDEPRRPESAKPLKKNAPKTQATAAADSAEVEKATRQAKFVPAPQETFEQVLAAQMQSPVVEPPHAAPDAVSRSNSLAFALTGITSIAPLPEGKPTVHLTMRLTPDEREALRQRASELGVTPAAYARQCALQMDLLRTELKNRQQSQQASVAPPLTQAGSQPVEPGISLSLKKQDANRHAGKNPWLQRLKNFFFPGQAKGQRFAARA